MPLVNRRRAQAVLTRSGVDALLATTLPNLRYILDWLPPTRMRAARPDRHWAILPADPSRPIGLVAPVVDLFECPPERLAMLEVRGVATASDEDEPAELAPSSSAGATSHGERAHSSATAALDDLLAALDLTGSRLAVDDPTALLTLAGETITLSRPTGADLFRRIRAVKTTEEINRLRAVTEANAIALLSAVAVAEPRRPWRDVAEAWRRDLVAAGADIVEWNSSLTDAFDPTARILARHEPMGLLGAAAIDGYWSELGRVAVVGDRLPKAERLARALATAMERFLPRLQAGAVVDDLLVAAARASAEAELPPPVEPVRGIGVERAELPAAGVEWENVLEPGNVVVVSFTHREPNAAVLTLAEPVLITATGPRRLSSLPFDLLITRG